MRRIVKVLAVAVLVATVLAVASIPAFARPLRGGLPLQNEKVCAMLAEDHPRFEVRTANPTQPCWHISPGLERASEVVPPA